MSVLTTLSAPHLFFSDEDFFLRPFRGTTSTTSHRKARTHDQSPFFLLPNHFARDQNNHSVDEREDAFQLFIDFPGVKAADIAIKIDEGILKISGSRKFGGAQQSSCSSFVKSFSINESEVDASKISANLADGVLAVTFPKRPKAAVVTETIKVTESPHQDWVTVSRTKTTDGTSVGIVSNNNLVESRKEEK